MQKALACFPLGCQEHLNQRVFQVTSCWRHLQSSQMIRTKRGVLRVVGHVHVDHVHRLKGLLLSDQQLLHHPVVDALRTGEDDVKAISALLKSFRARLDSLVSSQDV